MANKCGFTYTELMLPSFSKDAEAMKKWACVACDQYTSEPEYWEAVEKLVGDAPSTLNLMLPEIYLSKTDERSPKITSTMNDYINSGVLKTHRQRMIYVKRTLANGKVRRGLVGAIDLEVYDFSKGSTALCRPTEMTVTSRLPARVEIRKNAPIEMPHIMMLINDKERQVIEELDSYIGQSEKVYDFDLMQDSGHITGYSIVTEFSRTILDLIDQLCDKAEDEHPMIYAMGDGNHSLAAAKQYYEQLKVELGDKAKNHPARYALVELVNIYDEALEFEPIHRVFFGADPEKLMVEMSDYCGLTKGKADGQSFEVCIGDTVETYTFTKPNCSLTVGTIQNFLDEYEKKFGGETDYIHGDDVVKKLCVEASDRVGFIVDGIEKDNFFDVIKKDGVLPRKTFSMGHACDKRFYLECRSIATPKEKLKKVGKQVAFLATSPQNARNGEGTFVRLKDGRIMYAYTYYIGSNFADDGHADLYAIYSSDEGESWTEPTLLLAHDEKSQNYMSPSIIRMPDGNLGMIFNRKERTETATLCMPYFTTSADDGKNWTTPISCGLKNEYYCTINDGIVCLKNGRIMMSIQGNHSDYLPEGTNGTAVIFIYSDDCGKTWQRMENVVCSPFTDKVGLQEPGIYEYEDGRLWMYCRTTYGFQYESFSNDGGNTWSPAVPSFNFTSPDSPMRVKRVGDKTVAVYNPQPYNPARLDLSSSGTPRRTPFVVAVSHDDAKSFDATGKSYCSFGLADFQESLYTLENDPENAFCYPAIIEVADGFLVAYYHSNNSGHTLDSAKILKIFYSEL